MSSTIELTRISLESSVSHGFPMGFPWVSRFSHGFPLVFPWVSHRFRDLPPAPGAGPRLDGRRGPRLSPAAGHAAAAGVGSIHGGAPWMGGFWGRWCCCSFSSGHEFWILISYNYTYYIYIYLYMYIHTCNYTYQYMWIIHIWLVYIRCFLL